MFGYTFATYIYTPQMNLILLPFFVLLPVSRYKEFLAFDALNASIIILGFSEVLAPFGILYSGYFHPSSSVNYLSAVFWIEVVRSLWQGKFALVNGIPGSLYLPWWNRQGKPAIPGEEGTQNMRSASLSVAFWRPNSGSRRKFNTAATASFPTGAGYRQPAFGYPQERRREVKS
jgi:hypothetical protein